MMRGFPVSKMTLLLPLIVLAQPLLAKTWYVAPGGLDTNSGSSTLPFKTISKGVTKLVAGDRLLIAAGTYREQVKLERLTSITNITIEGAAAGAVVIDGLDRTGVALGSTLPVSGLHLLNLTVKRSDDGLHLKSATNTTIEGCEVSDSYRGLWIENGSNVAIRNCYVHDNDNGYLMGWGGTQLSGLTIEKSVAANNITEGPSNTDGFGIESACSSVIIRSCTAYGHGDSGFDIKPAGTRLDRCLAYNNTQTGLKLWSDSVTVTNSLIRNNACYGIVAAGNYLKFWNCTVANNRERALRLESTNSRSVQVRNCIFYGSPLEILGAKIYVDDYNLYYNSGTKYMLYIGSKSYRINQLQSGSLPLGAHSLVGNPRFVSSTNANFQLTASSPAIRKGLWSSFCTYDLIGLKRVSTIPPDLGCYCFISSPPPPPMQ